MNKLNGFSNKRIHKWTFTTFSFCLYFSVFQRHHKPDTVSHSKISTFCTNLTACSEHNAKSPSSTESKYLPTKRRANKTSCHLNNKRLHPSFNKPQIPKSIWIKVFDYQFPSNQRPRPSVASADRRAGLRNSQQGGIPPCFPSLELMQRSFYYTKRKRMTQKHRICCIFEAPHWDCFSECIFFNNSASDWRKKCSIHTNKLWL